MLKNLNAVFSFVHAVAKVSRFLISQLSAHAPGSHLTKARANSGKFVNHGIKPLGQQ